MGALPWQYRSTTVVPSRHLAHRAVATETLVGQGNRWRATIAWAPKAQAGADVAPTRAPRIVRRFTSRRLSMTDTTRPRGSTGETRQAT